VQLVQFTAPAYAYRPAGQAVPEGELEDDPAGQAYPARHCPSQAGHEVAGDDPNRPAGHSVHSAAPAKLYCPAGHANCVDAVEPTGQEYPAVQFPVHIGDGLAVVAPKVPARHGVHALTPLTLYVPAGQAIAVDDADPAVHAYPAVQMPLHAADNRPDADPNLPAGQGAVQAAVVSPAMSPYLPAGQSVQSAAPVRLYWPAGHRAHDGCKMLPPYKPAGQGLHGSQPFVPTLPMGHILFEYHALSTALADSTSARPSLSTSAAYTDCAPLAVVVMLCGVHTTSTPFQAFLYHAILLS
jgi:hypothetical protein